MFEDFRAFLYHYYMEKKVINAVNQYLKQAEQLRAIQKKRADELHKYKSVYMKKSGNGHNTYYYVREKDNSTGKYIGREETEAVRRIKEARFIQELNTRLDYNIGLFEHFADEIKITDFEIVNQNIPKVYQSAKMISLKSTDEKAQIWKNNAELTKLRSDTYLPEELNIRTNDGNMVRSKSEAMIYNYLLSMGVTFAYELPIKVGGRYCSPDFILLSEIDYKTEIIIEHQGMLSNQHYRNRFNEKLYNYYCNGFVQGINIFYTFDDIDGGLDLTPVENIVRTVIRPI